MNKIIGNKTPKIINNGNENVYAHNLKVLSEQFTLVFET